MSHDMREASPLVMSGLKQQEKFHPEERSLVGMRTRRKDPMADNYDRAFGWRGLPDSPQNMELLKLFGRGRTV
jgi:hypothetical protein